MVSITFFGTHNWALYLLTALVESGQYEIKSVVTQPDRPTGRKQELEQSPVKKFAVEHNIQVLQPESLKERAASFELQITSDLFIVCEYGLIIPQWVLDIPKYGAINTHSSLLPKYRGATPVQSALMNGETKTGITIMLMDAKMDHGSILAQQGLPIEPDDIYQTLMARLAPVSAQLLLTTLQAYLAGQIKPQEQNHAAATFCKTFTRDDGRVDFTKSAEQIYNLYRGLTPWPGIWTMWEGKRVKLLKIKPANSAIIARSKERTTKQSPLKPGEVRTHYNRLFIGCGSGEIEVLELQLEGKKSMDAKIFLNGYKNFTESTLS